MKNIKQYGTHLLVEAMSSKDNIDEMLVLSSRTGNLERVKMLLDQGAAVEARDPRSLETPLINAAYGGFIEIVKVLIERGADVNARDKWLNTPLHVAAIWDIPGVVTLLLDSGANPELRNGRHNTPLESAMDHNQKSSVKAIISGGGDPFTAFNSTEDLIKYFDGDIDWMPAGAVKDKIKRVQREEDLFGYDF